MAGRSFAAVGVGEPYNKIDLQEEYHFLKHIVNAVVIVEITRRMILGRQNHGSIGNQLPFAFSGGEKLFYLVTSSLLCSF